MLPLMCIWDQWYFFIKSYKSPTSHFNINKYLLVLQTKDLIIPLSCFTIDAPYLKISISIIYPVCGMIDLLLQQKPSSKSYTPTCGCTFYKNSKTTMFILFITSVPLNCSQSLQSMTYLVWVLCNGTINKN